MRLRWPSTVMLLALCAIATSRQGMLAAAGRTGGRPAPPASQGGSPTTGDAARGARLYDNTYRCYACHGFKGESGLPRLVPMMRTLDSFVDYLRKPATPQMPRFVTTPERDLADLYAYLRSLPSASPSIESVPLLKRLLQELQGGKEGKSQW